MNEDARRSGHKTPDCRGTFVDVTAMTDGERTEICDDCRAVRKGWPASGDDYFEAPGPGQMERLPNPWPYIGIGAAVVVVVLTVLVVVLW